MSNVKMSELKPCPYCGGEAHSTGYKDAYKNERHNVECSECGAEAGYGDATGGLSWTSESESTKAWNTRATDARVSELEELLLLTYSSVRKDYKSCTMDSDLNWSYYSDVINKLIESKGKS